MKPDISMKPIFKHIFHITLSTLALAATSCEDGFEELNQPYSEASISTASVPGLFNGLARQASSGENAVLAVSLFYPITNQQGSQNTWVPWSNYTSSAWSNYYPSLLNYKALLKKIDEQGNPAVFSNVRHMATVLMASRTLQMLDFYGDIPYTQASQSNDGSNYYRPAYDKAADIYKSVLADLKAAADGIDRTSTTQSSIGTSDSFLNSDLEAWVKFANALRLRYAVRLYAKEQALADEIIRDVVGGSKPLPQGQDVTSFAGLRKSNYGIWPGLLTPARDGDFSDRQWYAFRETSVNNIRMSENVWDQMSSSDDPSGAGIFDPRCYIFFQTNNADKWVPQPQSGASDGGAPYRNDNSGARPPIGTDPQNKYAAFNFFMIYDYFKFPYLIITEADVHFLKAEVYQRGLGVTKDIAKAKQEYEAGITSSVDFWYGYVNNSTTWLTKPAKPTAAQMDKFLKTASVAYDGSKDNEALTKIATQSWLANIYHPSEAWATVRRTGLTPKVAGYNPTTVYKFPYPSDEKTNNFQNWTAATGGADENTQAATKVYWMP